MEDEKIRGLKNPRLMEIKAGYPSIFSISHLLRIFPFLQSSFLALEWRFVPSKIRIKIDFWFIEPDIVDESVL